MSGWQVRPVRKEDIERFLAGTLPEKEEAYVWRWQTLRLGAEGMMAWVGIDRRGEIIGHYAFIPYAFFSNGVPQTACI